ncbi:MAG: hypothetical protein WD651_05420 [Acidimicrobiia bacterium]
MRVKRASLVTLAAVLALACDADLTTTTTDAVSDGRDAAEVAEALLEAMNTGDYSAAAALTFPDQMAWVVMAEGGSLTQAADLLDAGLEQVAANYWQGFAETTQLAEVAVRGVEENEIRGTRFAYVALNGRLRLILRNSDGWRVDVIASFAPTLVNRLIEAAQVVDANRGDQATTMREMLAAQRPSVEAASGQPGLPDDTRTDLLTLLEMLDDLSE